MNFIAAFAQTSLLHGRVVDEVNGQPLSCANISLLKSDKLIETTITDSNGIFKLNNICNDDCIIKIEYLGYYSTVLFADNFSSDIIQIKLFSYPVELPEVVISSKFPISKDPCIDCNMPYFYQAAEIKTVKAQTRNVLPMGDVPQMIAMRVPLIYAKDGGEDGKLFIAGSRSDATQFIIDGVIVIGDPHIPLNTLMSIEVTTFGIPAKYGDLTGGVVEVRTKNAFGF